MKRFIKTWNQTAVRVCVKEKGSTNLAKKDYYPSSWQPHLNELYWVFEWTIQEINCHLGQFGLELQYLEDEACLDESLSLPTRQVLRTILCHSLKTAPDTLLSLSADWTISCLVVFGQLQILVWPLCSSVPGWKLTDWITPCFLLRANLCQDSPLSPRLHNEAAAPACNRQLHRH